MQYSISHDFGQKNRVSQINSIFLPTLRLNLGLRKGEELCQKADSRCCVILASQLQFSSADCSSFAFKTNAQTKMNFFHNSKKKLTVNKQEMQQTAKLASDGDLREHLLSQ